MAASEGMVLRNSLKIRLPQVRTTMELIGAESKKGLGQIFTSAAEEACLRKLGHHGSGREKIPAEGKCTYNCASQLETFITDETKVGYFLAHSGKRESSTGLDSQIVKKQRINSTVTESLNCTGHSFASCKEQVSPEMSKWEKSGVESLVTHADKCGFLRGVDGQKAKKQTTDSIVTHVLNSESGPATTSCKGKRISGLDKLQKSTDAAQTKMCLVDKSEEESVVARVGELGPGKRLNGRKGKRQIIDNKLMQECSGILKKLMTHTHGWAFSSPVDPIKLQIPDYFSIISEPMDLGTIKSKLVKKLYADAGAFASDVRLTFSNAMRYNPPSNDFHIMASLLNNLFESLWKSLQAKSVSETSSVMQKPGTNGKLKQARNLKIDDRKQSAAACSNLLPRIQMSSTLRNKMRKDLTDISKGKISSDLLDCLRKFGLIGQHEERIQVDFNTFDDDKLSLWHRVIRRYPDSKSTQSVPVKNHSGRDSVKKDLDNGIGSGDRNACGNTMTVTSSAACVNCSRGGMNCKCSCQTDFMQASSDSDGFSRTGGNYACPTGPHNADPLANGISRRRMSKLYPNAYDDGNVQLSAHPATPVRSVASGEGWGESVDYDGQMSPEKALRAAMLKRRFADTIVRAKHNTLLCNGEKGDSKKMKKEKEILEKKQQEAKIRVATEAALRKNREAELRMQREREREAARIALEKMEKTVEIDESQEILKEVEMIACLKVIGSSIGSPLETLGLFLKADYFEEEEEDVINLNEDLEEGEIL